MRMIRISTAPIKISSDRVSFKMRLLMDDVKFVG